MMFLTRHPEIQCRQQRKHIRLDVCHQQLYAIDENRQYQ